MTQQATDPTANPKPRKPLWRRVLKWTFRIVLSLIVLGGVALAIFNYYASRELQGEIARIQAAGEPITFAQLEKSLPKVKEEDDAAPYYKAALALFRDSTDANVWQATDALEQIRDGNAAMTPELRAEIEHILALNALALEVVDRGRDRPQCAFDLGLRNGIDAILPAQRGARRLARLLDLRTLWLVHEGRPGAAADSLLSSLRMLRMFDRQPILISELVKHACGALATGRLPDVLQSGKLTDSRLGKLEDALAHADPGQDVRRVWIAERVYVLELTRNLFASQRNLEEPEQGGQGLPKAWRLPNSVLFNPVLRYMVARVLPAYRKAVDAANAEWPDVLEAMRRLDKERPRGWLDVFSDITLPQMEMSTALTGMFSATLRSAQVAVMVEWHRLAKGSLPRSLDELSQRVGHDLPLDPFTGKNLVYRIEGDGFMVYSIGEDGKDLGGPSRAQAAEKPVANVGDMQERMRSIGSGNFGVEIRMRKGAATAPSASAASASAPAAAP